MLRRAMEIAQKAHRGQVEKHGGPYIEHPMRLLNIRPTAKTTSVTMSDLPGDSFPETLLVNLSHLFFLPRSRTIPIEFLS